MPSTYPEAQILKASVAERERILWRLGRQSMRQAVRNSARFSASLDAALARAHGDPMRGAQVDGDYCLTVASSDSTWTFWMDQLISRVRGESALREN